MPGILRGVIAAIVTPVTDAGAPDFSLFENLAGHLLSHGCDGLNVLGTTGEATSFSFQQRTDLMRRVGKSALPKHRLMVGTGAAATAEAAELAHIAAETGFAGALVLPPFYYKGVSNEGILRYFDAIVQATRENPIPLYLYNFPALSGIAYTPGLTALLVSRFGDRIAGLKDSSGDMDYALRIASLPGRLDVFPSTEASLRDARTGPFAGCISATANVNAFFCARALHQADDGSLGAAVAIRKLFEGKQLVPGVKALLAHIMEQPKLAMPLPPFVALTPAETAELTNAYDRLVA